jgi:hypothetical protein
MNPVQEMNKKSDTRDTCLQLFTVSFITLFLELMIIRWVPANIRLIAYYANMMLISSFLGIGLGALMKGKGLNLFRFFPYILAVDVIFLIICRRVCIPGFSVECRYYSVPPSIINFIVVICIFLLNTTIFVPLGEKIGQLFDALPRLLAYSWDLGGSLLGTITFGCFSFLFFSPFIGFLIVLVLYFLLISNRSKWMALIPLSICLGCVYLSSPKEAIWSPYHYVTIKERGEKEKILISNSPKNIRTMTDPPRYRVMVNQYFYQYHGTIKFERYTKDTKSYNSVKNDFISHTFPYQLKPSPERVLVVGSGGGKEVEGALLNGSKYIDAVEIDPVIVNISKKINASGVYFDPRVHLEINDARAFFTNAKPVYDLIIFGYLDSQALFSSMSNIRLDGFVHTVESYRTAYNLLKEDGLLSLSFAAGTDWMMEKLILMMLEATGKIPIVYTRGRVISASGGPISIYVPKDQLDPPASHGKFQRMNLQSSLLENDNISLATDDWPFLYLKKRGISMDYLAVIAALILISFYIIFGASRLKWGIQQTHFFFLGLGFLLLETKSITDCSLYFGATWFVTMLVVTGILLMVLCANLLAMRLRSFSPYFYLPLIASMILLYFVPNDFILGFSFFVRLLWVLIFVPLPVLFAGLIFSTTFRESKSASSCFGANLIGATIGGFAEYLSMVIGFQTLSLLIIVAYLASLFFMIWIKGRL